ncbi:EVE domain-containing protein, partial [Delphinella strobiligena]
MDRVDDQIQEELKDAVSEPPPKKAAAKSKPAPKKTKKATKAQPANEEEEETEIADGPNYWLMKAEPSSRIEKNADGEDVDVKFSIDDLGSKTQPEPWEGIRNAQAQKNLKAMKKGDLAFFYESNCKLPGIVGIMEIVKEASPDEAAWDRKSAYYDAKSKKAMPKWMLVHVQLKRKFPQKISLKDLQRFSKPGDTLENMGLMKQSRLSVSRVSKSEWDFVMKQLGDD